MIRPLAATALLLALAAPALAQIQATSPAPAPAATAAPSSDPDFAAAQQRIAAGDYPGAIAALEARRAKPGAAPIVLALLGALYLETAKAEQALAVLGPLAAGPDADPAVLFNAGRAAESLGQHERAVDYWRKSSALDPSSPSRRALGLLDAANGYSDEALAALRPWALEHPEDVEARLTAASAALSLRHTGDAEQLLAGLPDNILQVRLLRARLALEISQPAVAVELLEPARPTCETQPAQVSRLCRRLLAEGYVRSGKGGAAIALLSGHTDDDVGLALLLADAQEAEHRSAAAAATLQPYFDKLPKAAATDEAQRWLNGVVARESGRHLLAAGKATDAVPRLRRSVEIDPSNLESWQLLAKACDQAGLAGERDRAASRVKQMLAAAPAAARGATPPAIAGGTTAPPPAGARPSAAAPGADGSGIPAALRDQLQRIRANLLLGRTDEALTLAEQCVQQNPKSVDALYSRGAARMAKKDLAHAESDYRAALALQQDYLPAMNDLAVLLLTQNKLDEARRLLERVVALNPSDTVAKANLASLKPKP